jgi:hypothetical protein
VLLRCQTLTDGGLLVSDSGSMAPSRNCKMKLGRAALSRQPRRRLFFDPALRFLLRGKARDMGEHEKFFSGALRLAGE